MHTHEQTHTHIHTQAHTQARAQTHAHTQAQAQARTHTHVNTHKHTPAFMLQITVTKTYNLTNLFEDIKALYKIAGFKGQSVCFLFTDAEVKDEGFLEYINQILMTGEQRRAVFSNEGGSVIQSVCASDRGVPGVHFLTTGEQHKTAFSA